MNLCMCPAFCQLKVGWWLTGYSRVLMAVTIDGISIPLLTNPYDPHLSPTHPDALIVNKDTGIVSGRNFMSKKACKTLQKKNTEMWALNVNCHFVLGTLTLKLKGWEHNRPMSNFRLFFSDLSQFLHVGFVLVKKHNFALYFFSLVCSSFSKNNACKKTQFS